jgi:hypothetical protein
MFLNLLKFKCFILFLSVLIMVGGCSDSSDDATDSITSLTSFNVAGQLNLTVPSTRVMMSTNSVSTVSSLKVFLQNQNTKKFYTTDVASNGTFSFDVGVNEAESDGNVFHMGLLNKDSLSYLATGVETIVTSSTSATTGVAISEAVSDLVIDYNASKSFMSPSSALNKISFDSNYTTRVDSNVVLGVASNGKGTAANASSVSSVNKLDPDQDGVPNIFDSMDDGVNLDNTDSSTREAAVAGSSVASYASMFMNYKVEYTASQSATITDNAIVTIEVVASNPSSISSIVADVVHTNYQSATFAQFPIGFTAIDSFPTQGTRWDSTGYKLYHAQNMDGDDIWTTFIYPNNNAFDVGDMIRLQATLTDGTIEYYLLSINFKFQDFQLSTDGTTWIHGGSGSKTDPFCILDTGGRVFDWVAPKDETGTDLAGVNYQLEFFFYEDTTPESVVHAGTTHVQDVGIDTYYTSITQALVDTYETSSPSPNILQVDIKSSYDYGDNSAILIYMARKKWGTNSGCPD